MAGIITALIVQKRNKERVNVFLDDEFVVAVTAVTAAGLKKGQYLSDADLERLKSGDEVDRAYERAIRFLGFRPRSQQEVERYLQAKGYPAEVVIQAVERLSQAGYLDDVAFARFWLENREQFRPRGAQALRYELRQKGIAPDVIETLLTELDEDESAGAALAGKLQRWRKLDQAAFQQKATAFLSRRGFGYDVASRAAVRAWDSLNLSE